MRYIVPSKIENKIVNLKFRVTVPIKYSLSVYVFKGGTTDDMSKMIEHVSQTDSEPNQ